MRARECKEISTRSIFSLPRCYQKHDYTHIQRHESRMDVFLLLAGLKACGSVGDFHSGKKIHSDAMASGYRSTSFVMNSIVHMYSKCGSMDLARDIFDAMEHHRTDVSWNSLILGYATNGQGSIALDLFHRMREDGSNSPPNSRTFVAAIAACSSLATKRDTEETLAILEKGRMIHSLAKRSGCDSSIFVANSLIDMYSKCGSLTEARQVFDAMVHRSIVSWNCLMLGYVENGEAEQALGLFSRLEREGGGILADARTLVAGLMACSSLARRDGKVEQGLKRGVELHSKARKLGYESQLFVANSLIDMYCKCGKVGDAKLVFDSMPVRDVVSWNSLLLGFSEGGSDQRMVLDLFQQMQSESFSPSSRTFIAVACACSRLAAQSRKDCKDEHWLEKAVRIHEQTMSSGYDSDLFVGSSLVDMFVKCGDMTRARKVFDSMACHDTVAWNTLILGYSDNGPSDSALECFTEMRQEGTATPDSLTFVSVLAACRNLSAIEIGRKIHADVYRYGFEADVRITNCLVDFYGNCGCPVQAERVLYSAAYTDLVSFSSIIACYSRAGDYHRVFTCISQMVEQDYQPDAMTFSSVLSACSHAGLVENGVYYFEAMSRLYQVSPDIDHYHCLIDLLGRGNRLDDALRLVKRMPFQPNSLTWKTLLSAAAKWKNESVGKLAFDALAEIGDDSSATYSLLANIYTFNKKLAI